MKKHKNDAVDAEATVEAALRPSMSIVAVKTKEQQAHVVLFRSRDLYLRQRTQRINAIHGRLAEYGVLLSSSRAGVARIVAIAVQFSEGLPGPVFQMFQLMAADVETLTDKVATIYMALKKIPQTSLDAKHLRTMPGVGPIATVAIEALVAGQKFQLWPRFCG
ncbi:hypothetical protein [Tateyamaria sp.]|uniref:hypothetical protein n=1 Tax=Tateyamaria sp. TaxID=1929288 RepID=UPI00329E7D47